MRQERGPNRFFPSSRLGTASKLTSPGEDRACSLAEDVGLLEVWVAGQVEVVQAQLGVLGDPVGDLMMRPDERGARAAANQADTGPQIGVDLQPSGTHAGLEVGAAAVQFAQPTLGRKKFGDAMGLRLVIYPDYAVLDRPDPNEARRELSYVYRGGWGGLTTSPRSTGAVVVDLGRFDAAKAVGILQGAPQTLGIKASDITSTYLIVEPSDNESTPGTVSLSVYVSADYGSGYIKFTGDGNIERVNPPS